MPFSTMYWPSNRSISWSLTPTYLMSFVISILYTPLCFFVAFIILEKGGACKVDYEVKHGNDFRQGLYFWSRIRQK